jgi:hypothetical protein
MLWHRNFFAEVKLIEAGLTEDAYVENRCGNTILGDDVTPRFIGD